MFIILIKLNAGPWIYARGQFNENFYKTLV